MKTPRRPKVATYTIQLTETIERVRTVVVVASSPQAAGKRALAIANHETWPTESAGESGGEWDYAGQVKPARVASAEVTK